MTTHIEVKRNSGESSSNTARRFTKRVQGSGIVRKAKAGRYRTREESALKRKQWVLKKQIKKAEFLRLWKLGKIKDVRSR